MAKTVDQFRTEIMQEIGLDESNDNEGTSQASILKYISQGNKTFINYKPWYFRLKTTSFYVYPDTTIATELNTGDSSVVLAKTDEWGSSGRFIADMNVIEFTANDTATETLTIESGDVASKHEVGTKCLLMYPVPDDYNKVAHIHVEKRRYVQEDFRSELRPSEFRFWEYSIRETDGSESKYLVFPYHTTSKKVIMSYAEAAKDSTDTVTNPTGSTYIEIPDPWTDYLFHYVAERVYNHLEETNAALLHAKKKEEVLLKASVFDSQKSFGNKVPLKSEWDNPRGKLGIGGARRYSNQR